MTILQRLEVIVWLLKLKNWRFCHNRYFEGAEPVMVTTDLEIAKQVLIKDFSKFHSRQASTDQYGYQFVFCLFASTFITWKEDQTLKFNIFAEYDP